MRRRALIVLLLVASTGGGVIWHGCSRPAAELGHIVAIEALDDGSAVVAWRGRGRVWLLRLDPDGRTRWSREVDTEARTHWSLAEGDGVMVARGWHGMRMLGGDRLTGLSLHDGRVLWSRPTDPARWTRGDYRAISRIVRGRYIAMAEAEAPGSGSLFAVDAYSGRTQWSVAANNGMSRSMVASSHLVVNDSSNVVSFDLETGTARSKELYGVGCIVDGSYVTLTDAWEHPTLTAFVGGDLERARALGAFQPSLRPGNVVGRIDRCGTYGDLFVFTIETFSHYPREHSQTLVVVADRNGNVRRVVDVDKALRDREMFHAPGMQEAMEGRLARYVPYLAGPHDKQELVMLDLEDGVVAWSVPLRTSGAQIFGSEGRWYLERDISGGSLVVALDGDTGLVTGAIEIDGLYDTLASARIAGGLLWVPEKVRELMTRDAIEVAVLDAKTLAPQFVRGIGILDVTARTRAEFAQPAQATGETPAHDHTVP